MDKTNLDKSPDKSDNPEPVRGWIQEKTLPSGRIAYRAQKRVDGRKLSKQCKSRAEAEEWLAKASEAPSGDPELLAIKIAPPIPTFGDFHAEHRDLINAGIRPSTQAWYDSIMRTRVLPRWGAVKLDQITALDVQTWTSRDLAAELRPASVRACYIAFSKVLRSARAFELLERDPLVGVMKPKLPAQKQSFAVSDMTVNRIVEVVAPQWKAFILVLAYGGLRFSEAAALKRASFGPGFRSLRVEGALDRAGDLGQPKSAAGYRTVPLPDVLAAALTTHAENHAGPTMMFVNRDGLPVQYSNFFHRVWQPAVKNLGITMNPHQLRHRAVSLWIKNGATVAEVKAWAGHASGSTTLDLYGHLFSAGGESVIARINLSHVSVGVEEVDDV